MRYFALACDYDETLADNGVVAAETLDRLREVRASGRRLILVTGRMLDDLQRVFEQLDLFDVVVAENGALVYLPGTREQHLLGEPVPRRFVTALQNKGVTPLSIGNVIVATREPHERTVLETIRELGLELQIVFNKGAVMVMPPGINKGSGLQAALRQLQLSPRNVVGVGDAENDHAFLELCECSVAVKNALPAVKSRATHTLEGSRGAGVRELIDLLLKDDLQALSRKAGPWLVLGETPRGSAIQLTSYGSNVLLAGSSGGGKSTLAKALIERLHQQGYQFCVIDPEGDYENFAAGVVLGDRQRAPLPEEVLQLLAEPGKNAVVNLLGVRLEDRPEYFNALIGGLLELRARTGRPHWLVIDEAHHVLPQENDQSGRTLPRDAVNIVMVTVEPQSVLSAALDLVDVVFAVGANPQATIRDAARALGVRSPKVPRAPIRQGEGLQWEKGKSLTRRFEISPSSFEHHRHRRKYASGDVGETLAFYFTGPDGQLNLQCRNLIEFVRIARGVDETTWEYHRRRKDYSTWFRDVIKDPELAQSTLIIERNRRLSADESRRRIEARIADRYTLPTGAVP